jgi:Isocitrate dehydrogenase kinase/phosphatase
MLDSTPFTLPWRDKSGDLKRVTQILQARFGPQLTMSFTLEMVRQPFFRNKGAYLIGRLDMANQRRPLVLPLAISEQGELYIDACLTDSDDVSIVFGFCPLVFSWCMPLSRRHW